MPSSQRFTSRSSSTWVRLLSVVRVAGVTSCLWFAAQANAVEVQYSGFASLVAGRSFGSCVTDSTMSSAYRGSCTRFIADWAHAGVYAPALSLKPDSKLGLQGKMNFLNNLSATAQMVARFSDGTAADLEWLYLTYDINPAWSVQAGRKRLPLFYYSTSQDVGYAYPWARLPADIYGWDAVNYNGGSVTFRGGVGDWSIKPSLFGGDERTHDSAYAKLSYDDAKDVRWSNIRGADVEVSHDWFTTRVVYIESDYQQWNRATAELDVLPSQQTLGKQKIYGGSINLDTDRWLLRSEYSVFDRSSFQYKAKAWMLGVGVNLGKYTPMLTTSAYREQTRFPDDYTPLSWATQSLSVRYEIGNASALKLQFDHFVDGHNTFAGDARVIALAYDVIF